MCDDFEEARYYGRSPPKVYYLVTEMNGMAGTNQRLPAGPSLSSSVQTVEMPEPPAK